MHKEGDDSGICGRGREEEGKEGGRRRWRGREGRIEQGGGGGEERRESVKEGSGEKGCVHDNSAT